MESVKEKIKEMVEWALGLNLKDLIQYAEKKKTAYPNANPKELAQKIIDQYARKAGMEGFASGLPSNLIVAVPAAVGDMGYILRCYASLAALIGYLSNPKYFEDPDWKDDAYFIIAGPTVVSRALRETGVTFSKQASKQLIKRYVSKTVLESLKRFILKWFGKKVTQKAILTKTVPIVGGLIGGGWNWGELKIVGKRIIKYHFDQILE